MIVNLQQKDARDNAAEMQTSTQNHLNYPRFQAFWMENVVTVATAVSYTYPSDLPVCSSGRQLLVSAPLCLTLGCLQRPGINAHCHPRSPPQPPALDSWRC